MEIPDHVVPADFRERVRREVAEADQRAHEMAHEVQGVEMSQLICKTEGCDVVVVSYKGLAGWCSAPQPGGITHRQAEIQSRHGHHTKLPALSMQDVKDALDLIAIEPEAELVDHPSHYGGDTTYEVIKVLEAWEVTSDAYIFNVIKYLARAGKKPSEEMLTDLKKAKWYLDRKIERMETVGT